MTFWVHAQCKGPKIFFTILTSWLSKDAEFYVDFKIINLPLSQNAPKKSYSRKKNFFTTQGGPLCTDENLYPGISFFRWILLLWQVYIFYFYVKFCIFWYPWSPYWVYLYLVHDQKWSGHWVKTLFSFIFVTSERYVTNLRGTFVPVPKSTHPTVQYCSLILDIFTYVVIAV
jgi:hypothetical protein